MHIATLTVLHQYNIEKARPIALVLLYGTRRTLLFIHVHVTILYTCTCTCALLKPSSTRERLCYTLLMRAKSPKQLSRVCTFFLLPLHTWFFIYMYMYMCVYVHICIYVCLHISMYIYVCMYVCMTVCVWLYVYDCMTVWLYDCMGVWVHHRVLCH